MRAVRSSCGLRFTRHRCSTTSPPRWPCMENPIPTPRGGGRPRPAGGGGLHVMGEGEGMEPDLAPALSRELDLEVVGLGEADLRRAWRAPLSDSLPPAAVP